jgi:hypothetical protein
MTLVGFVVDWTWIWWLYKLPIIDDDEYWEYGALQVPLETPLYAILWMIDKGKKDEMDESDNVILRSLWWEDNTTFLLPISTIFIRELKDFMIRMDIQPRFVQLIDIIVVDIPESYGLLLSRDLSEKLNGYFITYWDHLWFPLKGHIDMLRIDREIYLKHTLIDLESFNEPSSTYFPMVGNYSCNYDFENFSPLSSDVPLTQKSKMTFQVNLMEEAEESILCQESLLETIEKVYEDEKITRPEEVVKFHSQVWTLYFDGSKSQGSGARCVLIDPKGKRNFLSFILEFECTNNTAEYEALV